MAQRFNQSSILIENKKTKIERQRLKTSKFLLSFFDAASKNAENAKRVHYLFFKCLLHVAANKHVLIDIEKELDFRITSTLSPSLFSVFIFFVASERIQNIE